MTTPEAPEGEKVTPATCGECLIVRCPECNGMGTIIAGEDDELYQSVSYDCKRCVQGEGMVVTLCPKHRATDATERELREEWWLDHGHGIGSLYGDDGEMQCHKCVTDFKRTPLDELRTHVNAQRQAVLTNYIREAAATDALIEALREYDDNENWPCETNARTPLKEPYPTDDCGTCVTCRIRALTHAQEGRGK